MNNNPMAGMMNNMIGKAMGNNPVFALIQAMRSGGNPMALVKSMAQTDPRAAQALKIINGKNSQQLESIARNMCESVGTTPEQVARQLGIPMK